MKARWYFVLLLVTLLVAACGGGNGDGDAGEDAGEAGGEVETTAETFEIAVGNELAFDPAAITVADGTELTVTMVNSGALEHNFVWLDQEDGEFINTAPGETKSNSRAFSKPGVYGFYCDIPGHREAGMVGEVTVEE